MENLKEIFRFSIGEQYEKYEFDLEHYDVNVVDGIELVTYKYVGKESIVFLNMGVKLVLLSFNADILCQVEYYLEKEKSKKILSFLELGLFNSNNYRSDFHICNELTITIIPQKGITKILYQKS